MPTISPSCQHAITSRWGLLVGALALLLALGACSGSSTAADSAKPSAKTSRTTTSAKNPTAAGPTADPESLLAERPFTLRVPPHIDPAMPAPLLILLHGYGVTGAIQEAYLKLGPVTDAHGMFLAVLDGTTNPLGKQFWNATDACCGPRSKVDDSAYVSAVIADVEAKHDVDPKRVYLMGHSNGAFMSYRMACDHADAIAAIVSIAGATFEDPARCTPSEPVAVLEVHGTGDKTIAYDGGKIGGATYPGAVRTVRTWARYDGCRLVADRATPPKRTIVENLAPATVTAFDRGCRPNGVAELWTQPDGPHIPPFTATFPEQAVSFLLAHPKA
jgi:polyhydroxybutyrate depolymerase